MKDNASPLFSQYILDGVQMTETPFSALYDCLDGNGSVQIPDGPFDDIVDEYMDKEPRTTQYNDRYIGGYVSEILHTAFNKKAIDMEYPAMWTISAINAILLDALFRAGHFILQDLLLMARWDWNTAPAGSMAAFYESTVTAGHYLFDLGVKLDRYFVEQTKKDSTLEVTLRSRISSRRACPDTMNQEGSSWLVYIPFAVNRRHLGGSALAAVAGGGNGPGMDLSDADYFIDCYEVVRELVEDGIITAGVPVGRGGLITAAEKFKGRKGFALETSGIVSSTGEADIMKILFAEVPGVLVQIRNDDYDYLDSQMLLQEIMYFPVGKPDLTATEISVSNNNRMGIGSILESLLSQTSEGED